MKSPLLIIIVAGLLINSSCCVSSSPNKQLEVTRVVEVTREIVVTATPLLPAPTFTPNPLEPADVTSSKFIKGNASPVLPDGSPGELSVISLGSYNGNILPIIVRNNTERDVSRITVSVVARSANGEMLASGGDLEEFIPNLVYPGGITMGYVYFGLNINFPADVTYEFKIDAVITAKPGKNLEVIEVNVVDNRLLGMVLNPYDVTVDFTKVVAMCFSTDSSILSYNYTFIHGNKVNPGETVPFQIQLPRDEECPIYLVAVSGL